MRKMILITEAEWKEFEKLKIRDIPRKPIHSVHNSHWICPRCGYVVNDGVPKQYYCDRCGQRLAV